MRIYLNCTGLTVSNVMNRDLCSYIGLKLCFQKAGCLEESCNEVSYSVKKASSKDLALLVALCFLAVPMSVLPSHPSNTVGFSCSKSVRESRIGLEHNIHIFIDR